MRQLGSLDTCDDQVADSLTAGWITAWKTTALQTWETKEFGVQTCDAQGVVAMGKIHCEALIHPTSNDLPMSQSAVCDMDSKSRIT